MVLLTQTPAIVSALEAYCQIHPETQDESLSPLGQLQKSPEDPPLSNPTPGAPISHGQVLELFQALKKHASARSSPGTSGEASYPHLPELLRGSQVYTPPPPPKREPSSEYKALMARLRQEAETAAYNRMSTTASVSASSSAKNPFRSLTAPSSLKAWDLGSEPTNTTAEDEEQSLRDINAQISLIVNVLVSIIACGVTFFLLLGYTRWSNEIKTLASMFGALVVGLAEVVLYFGFMRTVGESKILNEKERRRPEHRTVEETWVIEGTTTRVPAKEAPIKTPADSWEREGTATTRRRKGRGK